MDKKLNHIIDNGTFYLYYDDTLILQNGKSMPFIVLKRFVNGVESDLALYEYTFEEKPGDYEFIFSKEEISVKVKVTEGEEGKVKFSLEEVFIGEYEEMCITLWKENEDKVYGLPMYQKDEKKIKYKWLYTKLSNCKCKYVRKKFQKEPSFMPEQKLSFYLSGKYFFENINLVSDYVLAVADKIYLTVKSGKYDFRLRFCENMEELYASPDINNYKVKKYPEGSIFLRMDRANEFFIDEALKKDPDGKIKGVILEYKDFDLATIMTEKRKIKERNLDVICVLNRQVCEQHAKKYFEEGDTYKNVYGELNVDFTKQENVREYMVTVRKLLDTGVDGIYFDDNFNNKELTAIHEQIKTVAQEYPQVSLFHTHLSEDNDDFGYYIVKDKKTIDNIKSLRPYYFYSGECYIGKEEKIYTENNIFDINIIKID